ncbi:MAG: SgcJ/EcaC family oxidoreductase [Hyphomicrobiales bacterium]|nr:SgcJ/EcaC family oxidoreductase [Hyphomicrobiales bacterium]
MSSHPLHQVIAAADRAITAEDFDALMDIYADDAVLVIQPGRTVAGKGPIRAAFEAIAAHFGHRLAVRQGRMEVLEAGDTALVIMETLVEAPGPGGAVTETTRRATYVFRRGGDGRWLCLIDNSYGTDLLAGP